MPPKIVPDYCLAILKAFSEEISPSISKRKGVKSQEVLDAVADSLHCDPDDLEDSYRYLLNTGCLELYYPGRSAMAGVSVPGKTETRQAATKFHRILSVTPAGLDLLALSQDEPCKPKLSVLSVFDTVCKAATLGKTILELKNLLLP